MDIDDVVMNILNLRESKGAEGKICGVGVY